ncbi:Arm DNA-binding domain-containing protein, partial [Bradyrhizobium sp.]|uniref:Arm DNA-binding domain-containing protein n=1 Tax=Bradyrhizobium sp. TaxID=376 RepID=UPI003D0CC86F
MPRLDPKKVVAAIKESEGNKTLKRISDGQSLYLMVRNGRGYWSYSWRDGASFRTKLLGSAAMSPAKARIAREEEATKRRSGIVFERRGAANRRLNPAPADAAGKLFGDVVVEYLAKQAVNWTGGLEGKEARSYCRSLTGNAFAMIPVADIATGDVEAALEKFTPGRSEKMRMRINKILDYSTVKGYRTGDNPARLKGH